MNQEKFTLFQGDSREVIKQIPDNSIDSVVTDPPYGLNFMGKYWDTGEVAFDPKFWEEVLRVLKPGGHLLAFSGSRTYHRMACAIEDAGFEIRDQIMWLYGCLSEDSEILTKTGWKKGVELDGSELVAQWDHETNEISFVVPERVIIKPYVGKMVHLSNRHTDQLLTPDHRVYAKIRRHSRDPEPSCYEVVPAGELKDHWHVDIPMSGNLNNGEDVDPDYAYLVGWFLTDAWVHGDGKAVMFSQSKPHTLALLREALSKYDHSEYTKESDNPNHQDEHTFYVTGDIATKLINDWPERELDWRVLSWSAEARKRLLDGLIDGDGSRREHQHGHQFWSKKPHRLDIVSALYSMQGWRAYVNYKKGCVEANPKGKTQLQYKHRKNNPLVDYSGLVWCVTVPTGAFVARRNGKVFITGNSGFPKSHDVSKGIDKAAGAERTERRAPKPGHEKFVGRDNMKALRESGALSGDGGFSRPWMHDPQKVEDAHWDFAPATEAARQWQGWGTALKPAHEPIVVARKPLVGTVAENVLTHGTGALNIDASRIMPVDQERDADVYRRLSFLGSASCIRGFSPAQLCDSIRHIASVLRSCSTGGIDPLRSAGDLSDTLLDRVLCERLVTRLFPSGVWCGGSSWSVPDSLCGCQSCRHSCDEHIRLLREAAQGGAPSLADVLERICSGQFVPEHIHDCQCSDHLSSLGDSLLAWTFSFFVGEYCTLFLDAPRIGRWPANVIHDGSDEVLAGFPVVKSRGNRGESKSRGAKKEDVYSGGWVSNNSGEQYNHDPVGTIGSAARFFYCAKASKTDRNDGLNSKTNNHPTVKPTKLMQYLCRLVTPPGGTVLDPFTGSGSTGRGAILEGFRFVGIEREPEYIEIAEARIRAVSDNHSENNTDTVSLL